MKKNLLTLILLFQLSGIAASVPTIDLMCLFEKGAQLFLKNQGYASTKAFAEEQVALCNQVLTNSQITEFQFRLVHVEDIDYTTLGDYAKDLKALSLGSSGLDQYNVDLRKIYGADIVAMFADNGQTNGLFGTMNGSLYWNTVLATHAPSMVVSAYGAKTGLSFIHELGHSLGAGHAREQNDTPGPQFYTNWKTGADPSTWAPLDRAEDYSAAYYYMVGQARYTTLMGYVQRGDSHAWTRTPYFSSPALAVSGVKIGSATENNVRIIKENWTSIANLQPTKTNYTLTVSGGTGNGSYPTGAPIALVANPAPTGKYFSKWTTSTTGTFADPYDPNTIFTMGNTDCTVTAEYKNKSGAAAVDISTHEISLTAGNSTANFVISNLANNQFDYTLTADQSWITLSPASGTIYGNGSESITITTEPYATIGAREAIITVAAAGADKSPRQIRLTQQGAFIDLNFALDIDYSLEFYIPDENASNRFSPTTGEEGSQIPLNIKNIYCASGNNGASIQTTLSSNGTLYFDWTTYSTNSSKTRFIFEVDEHDNGKFVPLKTISIANGQQESCQSFSYRVDISNNNPQTVRWRTVRDDNSTIIGYLDNVRFNKDQTSVAFNPSEIIVGASAGSIQLEMINDGNIARSFTFTQINPDPSWGYQFDPQPTPIVPVGGKQLITLNYTANKDQSMRTGQFMAVYDGGGIIFEIKQHGSIATSLSAEIESKGYVFVNNNQIVVQHTKENQTICLFDTMGRLLMKQRATDKECHLKAPKRGLYFVTIDHQPFKVLVP